MKFYEAKVEKSWTYTVEDVFGKIVITSPDQLDAKKLDTISVGILRAGMSSGMIGKISFTFDMAPMWTKEEDPKIVNDPGAHKHWDMGHIMGRFPQAKKARGVTAVLCFFLGGFGVHRFYVGKVYTGIIQCLLSLSLIGIVISAPWALIDLIVIVSGKFKDKEGALLALW